MSDKKAPEPMDPSAPEKAVGEATQTKQRTCYAAKQLMSEVLHLFPETAYEIGRYNGRNVGLDVIFADVEPELDDLLALAVDDPRIGYISSVEGYVLVAFLNQPRTYDLRDPFGLDEAWMVLGDDLESGLLEADDDEWPGGTAISTSPDIKDGGGA